jgi:RimJ/RimL family protein N-acetyltransferase
MGRTLSAMPLRILDGKDCVFRDEDFWMLAEIETHPEVMRWNIDVYTSDRNEMYRAFKESLKKLRAEKDKIFLVGKLNDKVVGFVGVKRKSGGMRHVGEVGISVHPNYWNKGFGTRLLKTAVKKAMEKGFLRLELETLASNKAMIKIAEKAGFKIEGIMKMRIKKDGKCEDEVLMGIVLH